MSNTYGNNQGYVQNPNYPIAYQQPYFQPAQGVPTTFQMMNNSFNPNLIHDKNIAQNTLHAQNNHPTHSSTQSLSWNGQNPAHSQSKSFAEFIDPYAPSSVFYPPLDNDPFELKEIKPTHPISISASQEPKVGPSPTPSPTSSSFRYASEPARRRCKKCAKYYANDQEECRYHTGHYQSIFQSSLVAGGVMAWNCCKQADRNAIGCKSAKHIECEKTSAHLLQFPTEQPESRIEKLIDVEEAPSQPELTRSKPKITDAVRKAMRERTLANKSLSLDPESLVIHIDGIPYFQHYVEMTDTVRGLSLRYNVPTEEIKTINKFNRDEDIWTRNEILIPFSGQQLTVPDADQFEAQRKARLVRRFKRSVNIQEHEALYYLDTFDYDYDAAMEEYKQDSQWEKNHPVPRPMSIKI
eukprot:TRINITY_DN21833_c0_g1_i1.p1 TRINITY_DN21833_c0_g1~~TRINITY_DN21833_c0_g1_i1.p1  ORF type:complete len:410 (+),score=83.19 TRINITY_DN21833_c0_g1_i1:76-1305(+)